MTTPGTLLQRIHLAATVPAPDDLYVRAEAGTIDRTRSSVTVHPSSLATTRTYFGRVEASHWQRWTRVRDVEVHMTVRGHGTVLLVSDDFSPTTSIVERADVDAVDSAQALTLRAPLDHYLDEGHLWLEISTTTGSLTVSDVTVTTPTEAADRLTGLVICTYNRPTDCVATLGALVADPAMRTVVDSVVVVDQGDRLIADEPGFDAVAEGLGERLLVVRQPNLGGAGGFTRGMLETRDRFAGRPGDVLLMDDDIRLDPETVLRMSAFGSLTLRPTLVGGQMLNLHHPSQLVAQGENTALDRFVAGVPSDRFSNADLLAELPGKRVDADYAAWWACLVPAEVIDEVGLPIPLFFQWDDIEFGIRARSRGHATVTLPGSGVWHADFAMKDWDDWPLFFRTRNALIVSSLYLGDFPGSGLESLGRQLRHFLVEYRYGLIATVVAAIDAFLDGPDQIADGGRTALAAVHALRADHPETKRLTPEELAEIGLGDVRLALELPMPDDPDRFLRQLLRRQLRLKVSGAAAIDSITSWWHAGSFSTVVATDRTQSTFRVRRISRRKSLESYREIRRALRQLKRRGPAAQAAWRAAMPELTSRDNWDRLFRS
ncbi:glycosyltransferase [Aeromicrobium sp. Sec7.5]|uniref:glycosyltransferase n=1 Tax=Aeromicrobium sp. Sec7.5 TaxID=3121276 RepID=UPI002FE4E384